MIIILVDGQQIRCEKIEPSLIDGYIVINEGFSIKISDVDCIVKED